MLGPPPQVSAKLCQNAVNERANFWASLVYANRSTSTCSASGRPDCDSRVQAWGEPFLTRSQAQVQRALLPAVRAAQLQVRSIARCVRNFPHLHACRVCA